MRQQLLIGGAVLTLAVALALILPSLDLTSSPFSAYDSDDEDTSILVNGLRAQGFEVQALSLGPPGLQGLDPGRTQTLYVAMGIDRGYTGPELDALFSFLEDGGRAVILDDTGASGSLLDRLGVDRGSLLFATTGDQPSVVDVEIDGQVVTLWEPVELLPRQGADVEVLARTPDTVAKDANDNGEIDGTDPTCGGGCVVAVRAAVGDGSLTFVSDVTMATNRYATGTNVIQFLVDRASEGDRAQRSLVVVDESRHVAGPAEVGLTAFRALLVPLGIPEVSWSIAGLIAAATVVAVARRGEGTWSPHDPGLEDPYLTPEPGAEPEPTGDTS